MGAAVALLAPACTPEPAVDLVSVARAGHLGDRAGRPVRIADTVHATLPASPPSRLVLETSIPKGGRLVAAAGVPRRHHRKPGVEFVVKVGQGGDERTVLSRVVDPVNRPADRGWVPLAVDLSGYAGSPVQVILETRGFEETGEEGRAFWGTPVLTAAEPSDAPLVIVYLVDTLRADHLSLYGYDRETSPELSRLARDGVVFDQALSSSSWTKPSVASLFTSLRPDAHGCHGFNTPLDTALVTLAELLTSLGFATGAVVANDLVLAEGAGFDQGFGFFAGAAPPGRAAQVVDGGLEFLDARRGLASFLYLHTMDPHTPYAPPPPFDRRFDPKPLPDRGAADPRTDDQEPGDRDRIVAQYDGAIAYGDQELGRLVEGLKERGLYERALLVFVADHGEELLDHGGWMHGHTVYDELVRVPLVVKFPGGRWAGETVSRQVELLDVLPTILEESGEAEAIPSGAVGRSLQKVLGGSPGRLGFCQTNHAGHVIYAARTPADKLIVDLHPEGGDRYFDLVRDPGEQENRLEHAPSRVEALRRAVREGMAVGDLRYELRVEDGQAYELQVGTTAWIESLETEGLEPGDLARVEEGGRLLRVHLGTAAPGARAVRFLVRPHGAPLWIDGTRGGRPLRADEVRLGASHPPTGSAPFVFPPVERMPSGPPVEGFGGLRVWAESATGRGLMEYDAEGQERLRALGYID